MKRRAAIEFVIGHLKSDHRLSRNYLKGDEGNVANVILSAAEYSLAKLLGLALLCLENRHKRKKTARKQSS